MPAPLRAVSRKFRRWFSSWRQWFVEPLMQLREMFARIKRPNHLRAILDFTRLETRFMPAVVIDTPGGYPEVPPFVDDFFHTDIFLGEVTWPVGAGTVEDYIATIAWGDGQYSEGRLENAELDGKGNYVAEIYGDHDFDEIKTHTVTMMVSGPGGSDAESMEVEVEEGQLIRFDGDAVWEYDEVAKIKVWIEPSDVEKADFTREIKVGFKTVEVASSPGIYPAVPGKDYSSVLVNLYFSPGTFEQYISIGVEDYRYDTWSSELLSIQLEDPVQASVVDAVTWPQVEFVSIFDDEVPEVGFFRDNYVAIEGQAKQAIITAKLKYESEIKLYVNHQTVYESLINLSDKLAVPGPDSKDDETDYLEILADTYFTVDAGAMTGQFAVDIYDNDFATQEDDIEYVGLEILAAPYPGGRQYAIPWDEGEPDFFQADLAIYDKAAYDAIESLLSTLYDLDLTGIDPYSLAMGLPLPCDCACSCGNPSAVGMAYLPGDGGARLTVSFISCATDGLSCGRYQTASAGSVILFDPLKIVYSTATASAAPAASARVSLGKGSAVPANVKVELTFNGVTGDPVSINLSSLTETNDAAISVRADGTIDKSDVYEWSMKVTALLDDDSGVGVDFYLDNQKKVVVRQPSGSPYGNAWNFSSLDRIYDYDTGHLVFATGDGWGYAFDELGGGAYTGPDDFFGTLVKNKDDTYTLTELDQTKKGFRTDGQLATVTDRHGLTITYTYDMYDRLVNILDPDGRLATLTYDSGFLRTLEQAGDRVTTFTADAAGVHQIVYPDDGGTRTFTYDGTHYLLVSEKWGPRTTTITYDSAVVASIDQGLGTVTKVHTAIVPGESRAMDGDMPMAVIVDPLNQRTTVSLDDLGRLLTLRTPDNAVQKWTLNDAGLPVTYVDPLDRTTTFAYVSNTDRISSITRPDKSTLLYEYDSTYYQLKRFEDSLGRVTTFTLNGTGDVVTITNALGEMTTINWKSGGPGLVESITDARKNTTTFTYDSNRRLETITDADNFVTTHCYDAAWNLRTVTDPLNRVTTYSYNKMRRLTAVTTPDKATTTFAYAAPGWRTGTTDPLGRETVETYDVRGWRIAVTEADGKSLERTTSVTYDPLGRVIETINPLGQVEAYKYNPVGRLVRFTDAMGYDTLQTFDDAGRLLTVEDPLENVTSYGYDATRDWLTTVTDPLNRVTTFAYDSEGQLTKITDAEKVATTYEYDKLGRVSRVLEADGLRNVTFLYDPAGNLHQTIDHFGTVTSYAYNGRNLLTKVTEAYGTATYDRSTEFAYDKAGQLLTVTDAYGTATSYGYDAAGRVTAVVEALGHLTLERTTQFGYDAAGRQTSITDALGTVTSFAYDDLDRLTKLTEAAHNGGLTRTTTFAYDLLNRLTASTDVMGTESVYFYDALSRLTLQVDGLTGDFATTPILVSAYKYDAAGRVTLALAPGGALTSIAYNDVGMPTEVTEAFGSTAERTTTFTYDKLDRVATITDPRDIVTSFAYDALSRVTGMTEAVGEPEQRRTTFTYGTSANTVRVTNPLGNAGTLTYDLLGRLAAQSDALSHANTFKYDDLDRLSTSADALGRTVTYSYDELSRVSRVDQPDGVYVTFQYDLMDRKLFATDALNQTTSFAYDALGRNIRITDGRGYHTSLSYDAGDRLTKLVDPNNNGTSFLYDGLGRLTQRTDAALFIATFAYDAAGRVRSTTDRAATRQDFRYDELGRRTLELRYDVGGDLVEALTFAYDKNSNVTWAENNAGAYSIGYDALNRAEVVQAPFGLAMTFTYDLAGNRTKVEDNRGGLMSSSYDAANRLTRRELHTSSSMRLAMDYAYTDADELLSVTRRNGSNTQVGRTTFTYDVAGRVESIRHQNGSNSTFQTLTYTYDDAHRVEALVRNSSTTSYGYDAADQLTVEGAGTYGYDPAGNMTIGLNGTMSYDTGNRLDTWYATKAAYYFYEYDESGNRIQRQAGGAGAEDGYTKYAFDHANRMSYAQFELDAESVMWRVDYTYDAFGNRIARLETESGPTTISYERYGIDMWEVTQDFWGNRAETVGNEAANVWIDLDATDSDALLYRRVYSPGWDQVAARLDDSNTASWYLTDRLGSVVGATDASGAPLATITYQAFGKTASGTLIDRYGYTGREYDSKLDIYHYRDRMYDQRVGRFLQEDPIRDDFVNLYRYVGNSPTNKTDPSGLVELTTRPGALNSLSSQERDFIQSVWSKLTEAQQRKVNQILETSRVASGQLAPGHIGCSDPDAFWQRIKNKNDVVGGYQAAYLLDVFTNIHNGWAAEPIPMGPRSSGYRTPKWLAWFFNQLAGPDTNPNSVGAATGAEAWIPVWGSLRSALNAFQNGRILGGLGHTLLAATDITIVKSLAKASLTAVAKGNKTLLDTACKCSQSGSRVILNVPNGTKTAPAQFVRKVKPGEKITDLVIDMKGLTWLDEAEHAVLSLARIGPGKYERVIVKGGRDGIEFIERNGKLYFKMEGKEVQVRRVIGHTHPRVTGPSQGDLDAMSKLGQCRSYIIEIGGQPGGQIIRPK